MSAVSELRGGRLPDAVSGTDRAADRSGIDRGSAGARLLRGRPEDPAWARPLLLVVLVVAGVLVFWNLTVSGTGNEYYAAAIKSGSQSWKAWFFGSLDPGSFITVDKPPLSLWLSGLSARIFGYGSFQVLAPQALCQIGAVALLFTTVRRALGPAAGLAAAALLAITPVAVAMGRYDNPDALLVLLLVASAWATQKAIASGRTRELVWAGLFVGLAFMTKMLQGWMVVPALASAYLLAGPPALWTRVRQLLLAGLAMVAVSAAWPLAVTLWPGSTPYIGGSTDGSVWDLILGYNGFGRLTGEGDGPGGGAGPNFGGVPGLWRMSNDQVGGQIAWLLPLALVGLAAGLWATRRAARTDAARAAWVLWGVWAAVHVLVFSTAKGIFHPYYVSALAPAVAVLAGAGLVLLIPRVRDSWAAFAALLLGVVVSVWVAVDLLLRTPDFAPWVRTVVILGAAVALLGALFLLVGLLVNARRAVAVCAVGAAIAVGLGPLSYSWATTDHALSSGNVLAGPASISGGGFGPGGGAGGRGGSSSADASMIAYLKEHQGSAKYLVAGFGSMSTASIIVASGEPVMTIGGFSGSDPAPTLAQFQRMVERGDVKYVLLGGFGGGGGPGGGSGSSSQIRSWVEAHGTVVSGVGNGSLYEVGS